MADLKIDFGEYNAFVIRLGTANTDFQKELVKFIEALGLEFIDILQDQIISKGNVDTGSLLTSFEKGEKGNIWKLDEVNYSLEIGSDLDYASFVNDGHYTCSKGQIGRWVPGVWNGDKFVYQANAKTGMYLRQQWVEGSHYFDSAVKVMEKVMPKYVEKKLEMWIESYFKQFLG